MARSARAPIGTPRDRAMAVLVPLVCATTALLGFSGPALAQIGRRWDAAGPGERCVGVVVPAGADLAAVMAENPPGTTYCLAAGTFGVDRTIMTQAGDRMIGAGRDATFIDGTGLPPSGQGIFAIGGASYFEALEVFGAPTPAGGSGVFCAPYKSDCGMAFSIGGHALTLQSIDCHDNGGSCVGGGGAATVIIDDLDCWGNGNAYSMTPEFLYAACVKRAAIYELGGDTTITNSRIHDHPWVGLWCDFCKYGTFTVEDSRIIGNGSNGILWEMSGGWSADDRAIIKDNVIQNNNRLGLSHAGGLGISTANDITVESNAFGGNENAGISVLFTAGRDPPQSDTSGVVVRDNKMNGDPISGCSRVPLLTRLSFERARVALYAALLMGILAFAVVLHRRLRVRAAVSLGIGGAGAAAVGSGVVLLVIQSAALCLNNA